MRTPRRSRFRCHRDPERHTHPQGMHLPPEPDGSCMHDDLLCMTTGTSLHSPLYDGGPYMEKVIFEKKGRIDYQNILWVRNIAEIQEFSIGHAVIARAILVGMERAVREMLDLVNG